MGVLHSRRDYGDGDTLYPVRSGSNLAEQRLRAGAASFAALCGVRVTFFPELHSSL